MPMAFASLYFTSNAVGPLNYLGTTKTIISLFRKYYNINKDLKRMATLTNASNDLSFV